MHCENGLITKNEDISGIDGFINIDRNRIKNIQRKYIEIKWNPSFKYGGPISVIEYYIINGEEYIASIMNGFWDKESAWNFAEEIREDINESIIQWW